MQQPTPRRGLIRSYFALTYLLVLINASGFLRVVHYDGPLTCAFAFVTFLVYAAVYLLPVFGLVLVFDRALATGWATRLLTRLRLQRNWLFWAALILGATLVQVFVYADKFIYRLYGFHINGFVLNLLTTRGGLASLGGESDTTWSFGLIIFGILLAQAALLVFLLISARARRAMSAALNPRRLIGGAVALALLGCLGQLTYGLSWLDGYTPVVAASNAFPLYANITFNTLAESFGMKAKPRLEVTGDMSGLRLAYPLKPLVSRPDARSPNIIILTGESLRWDMLDPTIMPATWALAQKSLWGRRHYSGANGTRMAMFSLFYGLYGYYWFPFLQERRGPVLIDELIRRNYTFELFTSAGFSYPEFDKTIFTRIAPRHLHERIALPMWRCDREQVGALLESIDQRDPAHPFMRFMFFESPHANYHFPPECAIRKPYAESLNYATMDLTRDIGLIKNRYINACHHLDTQVARVLDHLRARNLLDSTIVLVTGDHGEEFMEHGRWGHNSEFTEEQTRVPFVLWVPGQPPRPLDTMSSHLDLPATLLTYMGIENPAADYSFGYDLYGDTPRRYAVFADWNCVGYVDDRFKSIYSLSVWEMTRQRITTPGDDPLPDADAYLADNQKRVVEIMKSMTTFGRKSF